MNAITYAIEQVTDYAISKQLLEIAFISDEQRLLPVPVSIDYMIRQKVIYKKIRTDLNLYHGTSMDIPLSGIPRRQLNDYTAIYEIPKSLSGGRRIMSAMVAAYGFNNMINSSYYNYPNYSVLQESATQLLNSHSPIPLVSTASVELVGENVVQIKDTFLVPVDIVLTCRVENDAELNHIQPVNYEAFSQLVILAVKAYIYNNVKIPMDVAKIHGGYELGRIREELDSFSDALQDYREYYENEWSQISVMNDDNTHTRAIQLIIGGGY